MKGFILLLSLTLSLINRKKNHLLGSFLVLFACNMIFFQSSVKKEAFLKKYTAHIPSYSNQDIFVVSKNNEDILHPQAFAFPYMDKIQGHDDVLGITALASEGEEFYKTFQDPQVLIVSLKKGASVQKWIDTFESNPDFTAMNPAYYKQMYNRALICRNDALYSYNSLLSMISLISFIGIIATAGVLPFALRKEIKIFLLEGITAFKAFIIFSGAFILILSVVPSISLLVTLLKSEGVNFVSKLFIHALTVEVLAVMTMCAVIVIIARSRFGENRIN